MNDFFQQFKRHEAINEGLFGKLFNKSGKTQNAQAAQDVYRDNSGVFHFGENSTAKNAGAVRGNSDTILNFDFKNSDALSFVIAKETKFIANKINFDFDNQKVVFFDGLWESGKFIGEKFIGEFKGHLFIGNFFSPNSNYKSNPLTFEGGTFNDLSNSGILGLLNTISADGLADNESFNLITVPVGYTVQMRSANGIDCSVGVLKRLDKDSSAFKYEVTDGFSDTKSIKDLSWQDVKMAFKNFNIQKKGAVNIGNLIVVPKGDYIKELYISKSKSTFATPVNKVKAAQAAQQVFTQGQKTPFNLSKIPLLNIKDIRGKKPVISLSFDTPEEFAQFSNIVTNMKNNSFSNDLKVIKKGIKYGTIDGYGPYDYLKNIFNSKGVVLKEAKRKSTPTTSVVPPSSNIPSAKEAMERLNSFIYYFVENIVTQRGTPNETARKMILNQIKAYLGIQPVAQQQAVTQQQQQQTSAQQTPGAMNAGDIASAFNVKESIRNSVRNIINDSF